MRKGITVVEFFENHYDLTDFAEFEPESEVADFLSALNAVIRNYGGKPPTVRETLKVLHEKGRTTRDD